MLYVFHGSLIGGSTKKAKTLIESLRKKKPDAAFEHLTPDSWSADTIESHLGGQGLFSSKYIIFLDRVLENPEAIDQIKDLVKPMQESENIFIVLEGKLKADPTKLFDKNAEKVVLSDEKVSAKKADFNIFSLADAVGNRDAIKSWMIYRAAIDNGIESEAIIGTLFWQVKSMILSKSAANATAAGLNPFVFMKSKNYSAKYSTQELNTLLKDIISLYHDGHRGIRDLELATEQLILNCKK